jgi:hypothetical protein
LELPIGQLSEEAQEASNKNIKNYRRNFPRKCGRVENMYDVDAFSRLMVTSDPYITLGKLGTGCKDTLVICNSTFMALVI